MQSETELDDLRLRVRAARWGTSGPLLVFGVTVLVFAGYAATVNYSFVPLPLFWPLSSLVSLVTLAGIDRVRRGRSGVGAGRISYAKATVILVAVLIAGNLIWFYPFVRMLLWPATVLTLLALWQRNRPLTVRAGVVGMLMIAGWFVSGPVTGGWFQAAVMGGGGLALGLLGLLARRRERSIA